MYYRLKEPYAFRGWKKRPHAIWAEHGEKRFDNPFFFMKDDFLELLYCNGTEDVDAANLSERGRKIFEELLKADILEKSDTPMEPLKSWQRYHIYPSRYLESVHWAITGKCNFKCRHCLVSAPEHHQPQLPLEDCIRIIDEIDRCGIRQVEITGGEPLVRDDYEEIFKALSEREMSIPIIYSNAALLNKDVLEKLDKYGFHPGFQISFDGYGHHDWLRGVPGAEKKADAALRLLKEYGFRTSTAMCIHKENKDSLRDTVNYLADLGVEELRLNAPQELGSWIEYGSEYALSFDELWEVYKEYIPHYFEDGMPINIELDGYFRCSKGSRDYDVSFVHHAKKDSDWSKMPYCECTLHHIHIRPDGRVAPCMGFSDTAIGDKFPSVLEEHLGDITQKGFYHDVVKITVADLLEQNPECASCEHLPKCCGGCMVDSISEEGNYLIPHQAICHFFKNIGEDAVRAVADKAIEQYCKAEK